MSKNNGSSEVMSDNSIPTSKIENLLIQMLPNEAFSEVKRAARETGVMIVDMAVNKEKISYREFTEFLAEKFGYKLVDQITGDYQGSEEKFYIETTTGVYAWYPPYVVIGTNRKPKPMFLVSKDVFDDYERKLKNFEQGETEVEALYKKMLLDASTDKASDIHIEPLERSVRILFRTQQERILYKELSGPLGRSLINYIKSLCNTYSQVQLDENRIPQDGRLYSEEINLDIRVNFLPTIYRYNKVTMRLLYQEKTKDTLESLGFLKETQEIIRVVLRKPFGLILIVGGTGSGKSRTLSTMLKMIDRDKKCVLSIEDPVEYPVYGVTQGQYTTWVKDGVSMGHTFSTAARAFMRADPDVCLIGEIRDRPTATSTIALSNTGHLVLSTLHTNLSAGAPMRLISEPLSVSPTALASELMLVVGQKLVKRLCHHCRQTKKLTSEYLKNFFLSEENEFFKTIGEEFYTANPKGCSHCRGGYTGVTVVEDVLVVDDKVRDIILNRDANRHEIQQYVKIPFSSSVIKKSKAGIIDTFNVISMVPEV